MKRAECGKYRIVVEKAGADFSAFSPDLPGCVATGRTEIEATRRMRSAIRLHLQGLKEVGNKALRCGKCGSAMKGKPGNRMGLKITVRACPRCGKRLIGMDDAVRLQKRMENRIDEIQRLLRAEARRKGITRKELLRALDRARKEMWAGGRDKK